MDDAPTRTWLVLDGPEALRPAGPARLEGVEVDLVRPPDGAVSRWFYVEVGREHRWTDLLPFSDAQWQAWAEGVETWVARVGGRRAGYYELRPRDGDVVLEYFGLLPAFQGHGLGGALLTHALRRALSLGPRVALSTCTYDGPHALANYLARGLRPIRTKRIEPR